MSTTCECPFIKHISKSDWESLLEVFGFEQTRWLLTHCIIYVCVASRAWVQVNGSVDSVILKELNTAYPLQFGIKRKLPPVEGKRCSILPAKIDTEPIHQPKKVSKRLGKKKKIILESNGCLIN